MGLSRGWGARVLGGLGCEVARFRGWFLGWGSCKKKIKCVMEKTNSVMGLGVFLLKKLKKQRKQKWVFLFGGFDFCFYAWIKEDREKGTKTREKDMFGSLKPYSKKTSLASGWDTHEPGPVVQFIVPLGPGFFECEGLSSSPEECRLSPSPLLLNGALYSKLHRSFASIV